MRLPGNDEAAVICGRRGSGKTHEALWHLSQRNYDEMPWVAFDLKGDDLVSAMPCNDIVSVTSDPPNVPGLYVCKIGFDDYANGNLSDYFTKILEQGSTGIFIDEARPIGHRNLGYNRLLSQGRSKHCPMVIVMQRPAFIDTTTFAEVEYFQIFPLQHPDDVERIGKFVPPDRLDFETLRQAGPHHSWWYDIRVDDLEMVEPAPPLPVVFDRVLTRLPHFVEPEPERLPRRARL